MIRCAWNAFGETPCSDEAELVVDGRGLCEAHAMDRDYELNRWMPIPKWFSRADVKPKA